MKSNRYMPVAAALVLAAVFAVAALGAGGLFENAKVAIALAPISVDAATATCTTVDTAGYKQATLLVTTGVSGTTWDCSLTECATTGGTFVAITGGALTQIATGVGGKSYAIQVDMNYPRKRYLKPRIQAGPGGVIIGAVIVLHQGRYSPFNTTEAGVEQHVKI